MKPKIIQSILAAALLAPGALFAQTTATTTPVGYISHTVTGAVSGNPAFTLLSPTLVQSATFRGVSSVAPSGTTVTTAATLPGGIDSGYYVELIDAPNGGWWSTVVSVSGGTITVSDTLPANLPASTRFVVKKHNTIKSFLGSNNPGLDPGLGLDEADEVQILNPITQSISSYFYALQVDGAPVDGWYDSGGNAADDIVIVPGTAVMVVRKQSGNLTFTSQGEVKVTPTQVDFFPGFNWVTPMRASGVTLLASNLDTGNLATGVLQGVDLSVDEAQFIPASQSIESYFAADFAQAGVSGWYDSGGNNQDTKLIAEPYGIQLVRKHPEAGVWTVPAITIAP